MARLLCLKAAWMIDQGDARAAAPWISQIKVVAPRVALKVTDEAVQMFGAQGISQDTPLARVMDASEDAAAGRRARRRAPPPGGARPSSGNTRRKRCEPGHEGDHRPRFRRRSTSLVYGDWPEPQATGSTVVIEAEAIGVNYPDGLLVQGPLPDEAASCPSCPAWRSPAASSRSGRR